MDLDWEHLLWAALVWGVSLVVSLTAVVVVLARLPSTHFLDRDERQLWVDRHPAIRITLRVAKNLAGIGLMAAGLLLSLPGIPGQGILTIFIGLLLVDFPRKRELERKIVSRPPIRDAINRIRSLCGKDPLVLEEGE